MGYPLVNIQKAIENGPHADLIEFDLPFKVVIFHSYVTVDQRVEWNDSTIHTLGLHGWMPPVMLSHSLPTGSYGPWPSSRRQNHWHVKWVN